ncbi:MAG TPA: hypothetical protein VFZ61_08440 [Polyangiales bacterium]
MRPATLVSFLWLVFAGALALHGCGGAPKHVIQVGPMPDGGTFTGVWFSPQYGEMHIEQNGSSAIGRYSKDERSGRLQGSVEGDVLRFEWTESRELIVGRPTETKGHGYFKIIKHSDDDTWNLDGRWGNDASEHDGGPWTAVKSKTRRPDVGGGGGAAEPSSGSSSPSSSDENDYSGRDVGAPSGGSGELDNL